MAALIRSLARGLLAAGAGILCGCADAPEKAALETRGDTAAHGTTVVLPAWVADLRAGEAELLTAAAGRAERAASHRLVLTTAGGGRHVFEDEVIDGEPVRVHVYRGWYPTLARHLVELILVPEGGEFLLLADSGGEVLGVDGPPVASPDGSRFVTTSLDLVAGHRPNRIRIYRMVGSRPVLEWETAPREWGAAAPLWLDSGAIRLDRTVVDMSTAPFTTRTAPMHLQRDGRSWRIVP